MTEIEDRLAAFSGPTDHPAGQAGARADLDRGRRALRERRARRTAFGGLAALGVAAAVGVGLDPHHSSRPSVGVQAPASSSPSRQPTGSGADHLPSGHPTPHPTPHPTQHSTLPAVTGEVRMVAYHGEQEPGFTVRTIPAGFVLQGADRAILAVARAGDDSPIYDFTQKIVVTIETRQDYGPLRADRQQIVVQGMPGTIGTTSDGGATELDYVDGDRVVVIQAWTGLGVTDAQLEDFAAGVTAHADAETAS